MAFNLENVVPWGRNFNEYKLMFQLNESDVSKNIAGFGDGPSCFNYEATQQGYSVTSFDPIYQFSKDELKKRIDDVRITVMQQMRENINNYVWTNIKNLEELENIRMSAMRSFLSDFEKGKQDGRYIYHELPNRLIYADDSFDIGLSSHFLLMYTVLGYEFHIQSMTEMLRVCKEIRIFPIVDLDANKTDLISKVINYFDKRYDVEIRKTQYEFQKGDNNMLIIRK
ncbi:MAG: SAM-dependent methyltransferase [Ruminococcus flavefaciens]|nr:SAM-dependent methyltransferase [Ruminococcus flavefaciens]MCM1362147.1 SAM-dependent methyltransferase [Clostridiales bacterium]MCM1435009.1 SAM-dependent methyltransferase [Ruminococcus flavefaciens]